MCVCRAMKTALIRNLSLSLSLPRRGILPSLHPHADRLMSVLQVSLCEPLIAWPISASVRFGCARRLAGGSTERQNGSAEKVQGHKEGADKDVCAHAACHNSSTPKEGKMLCMCVLFLFVSLLVLMREHFKIIKLEEKKIAMIVGWIAKSI